MQLFVEKRRNQDLAVRIAAAEAAVVLGTSTGGVVGVDGAEFEGSPSKGPGWGKLVRAGKRYAARRARMGSR